MSYINKALVQLRITSATCSSVAIGTTIYRVYIRRTRFWYDDACALLSATILLIQICAIFIRVPDPSEFPQLTRVAAYYLIAVTFYTTIWSARLSILFSIIRLDPCHDRRKRLYYVAGLFVLVWAILMGQLFWVCEPEPGWRNQAVPQCKLNKQVAILQVVTDVISDSILIAAPLNLWRGLSDKILRRRLIIVFSTCIVTTIVSLVHAALIIIGGGPKVLIAALVEDCSSIIVCNIPIVAANCFNFLKHENSRASNAAKSKSSSIVPSNFRFARPTRYQATQVSLGSIGDDPSPKRDMTFSMEDNGNFFDIQRPPLALSDANKATYFVV